MRSRRGLRALILPRSCSPGCRVVAFQNILLSSLPSLRPRPPRRRSRSPSSPPVRSCGVRVIRRTRPQPAPPNNATPATVPSPSSRKRRRLICLCFEWPGWPSVALGPSYPKPRCSGERASLRSSGSLRQAPVCCASLIWRPPSVSATGAKKGLTTPPRRVRHLRLPSAPRAAARQPARDRLDPRPS